MAMMKKSWKVLTVWTGLSSLGCQQIRHGHLNTSLNSFSFLNSLLHSNLSHLPGRVPKILGGVHEQSSYGRAQFFCFIAFLLTSFKKIHKFHFSVFVFSRTDRWFQWIRRKCVCKKSKNWSLRSSVWWQLDNSKCKNLIQFFNLTDFDLLNFSQSNVHLPKVLQWLLFKWS